MKVKKGRPGIKPHIKQYIYAKALEDKGTSRLELVVEIKNQLKERNELPPSEETMLKLISKARNHPSSPLDSPFSIASLAEHDIPPEARPAVISVYKQLLLEQEEFSIREALWVARLYKIINPPELVFNWARVYAEREHLSRMTGIPFNSTELDLKMMLDVYYARDNRETIELLETDKDGYARIKLMHLERINQQKKVTI